MLYMNSCNYSFLINTVKPMFLFDKFVNYNEIFVIIYWHSLYKLELFEKVYNLKQNWLKIWNSIDFWHTVR